MLMQCCTEHVWTQWPPQMSGMQCGPGNVNMVKTLCIYLLVTWELVLRALLSLVLSTAPALGLGPQRSRPGENQEWKSIMMRKLSPELHVHFSSVQPLSHVQLLVTPWTAAPRLPHTSPTSGACLNSCPLSHWCHPTISPSVSPFSSCLQSFPALGYFPMSHFFASGGQSIWVSASAPVFSMNIQDWSPLGWTGWISLQSKGLSRVFSNTTVQKHQFFDAQFSLSTLYQ